ncbi:hypothetical protein PHIN7_13280 [Polynucleobacter sp. HIN7]|nr:hypothetical protein PHIN7_13280 [Polynucleobacter sp. HIN7]
MRTGTQSQRTNIIECGINRGSGTSAVDRQIGSISGDGITCSIAHGNDTAGTRNRPGTRTTQSDIAIETNQTGTGGNVPTVPSQRSIDRKCCVG